MNKRGSRSIVPVLRAILLAGNGTRISLMELAGLADIPMTNTVMKAINEAEANGLLIVERGHGQVASRYEVPPSIAALLPDSQRAGC